MPENTDILQQLGLDLERHCKLLTVLNDSYSEVFPKQQSRPHGMDYFDRMHRDLYSSRIKELVEHKEKGGTVVGTFCPFVPEEIIDAVGGISVRLEGGMQLPIADAETILPSDLCPMIKSSLGFKLGKINPYFEIVDLFIGETTCDGKKKVWEILNNYAPTYVVELPQKKCQMDRELWLKELVSLKEKIEVISGVKITAESLAQSIKVFNAKRKAMAELHALRRKKPPPISGKDASLISQIACYDDAQRFTNRVNELCGELEERVIRGEGIVVHDASRIMITGCPMALPNWKLHHLIETTGAVVVCEDTCSGARYFMDPIVFEESTSVMKQIKAIADRYLNIPCPCFTPGYCGVLQTTQMAKDYKIDGVVYYVLQFCHSFNVEYYKVERFLKEAGIPVLRVQIDYSEEDIGQLKTRIEAFLEMLKV
jgi:benzoyl-CoA reductase/2-hydroxyglutaryl-CoA dehydratase subunit BcrC/BadD/HgdB